MKNSSVSSGALWKRLMLLGLGGLLGWWLYGAIQDGSKRDAFVAVDLGGKQHIGPDFNISEFYLNGTNGFNVGREGGGGSDVCCVLLPKQWRPDLSVDLRWEIGNWINVKNAVADEKNVIPTFTHFKARVPVEKYEIPERVVVHFFKGGKARVVVGSPGPNELLYATLSPNSRAADFATVGQPVDDLFTKEEISEMYRREYERKKKYGGDWK